MGTAIEKCILNQSLFTHITPHCFPSVTAFSCTEAMAESENPVPFLLSLKGSNVTSKIARMPFYHLEHCRFFGKGCGILTSA